MNLRTVIIVLALVAAGGPAAAVQPLRLLAGGFEVDDPQRDCAVDASTETALAGRIRATQAQGFCVPPFNFSLFNVCGGASPQCASGGCFVPFGPTQAAAVDAVAGRMTLTDAGGTVGVAVASVIGPSCSMTINFASLALVLDYTTLNDGLDGVLIAGLAAPPIATTPGSPTIDGCVIFGSQVQSIVDEVRSRVLTGYADATLARIGEPLDAAVCPVGQ